MMGSLISEKKYLCEVMNEYKLRKITFIEPKEETGFIPFEWSLHRRLFSTSSSYYVVLARVK